MEFYELRNFTRNKYDKIYEESKFAVLDEMGERRYVTDIQVTDDGLFLVIPTDINDYYDGIEVSALMDTIASLEEQDFDGCVYAAEDGDWGREVETDRVYVNSDDYVVVFEAEI